LTSQRLPAFLNVFYVDALGRAVDPTGPSGRGILGKVAVIVDRDLAAGK
jgi:hypothetical protein